MDGGTLENCTIVGNQSGSAYGGIWNRGGVLQNLIVYSNTAPSSVNFDTTMAFFTNSCTVPLANGTSNITNNPAFVLWGSGYGTNHIPGDYRLTKLSLCRDTGTNLSWMTTAYDLDGRPRLNGIVDQGAYEFYYGSAGLLIQVQ